MIIIITTIMAWKSNKVSHLEEKKWEGTRKQKTTNDKQ